MLKIDEKLLIRCLFKNRNPFKLSKLEGLHCAHGGTRTYVEAENIGKQNAVLSAYYGMSITWLFACICLCFVGSCLLVAYWTEYFL